jgi:hypothetical protein
MNADDNMRAPFLEKVLKVSKTTLVKEFAGLGTKFIYRPVEILHPALLIAKDPVIKLDASLCDTMRVLDCAYDPNRCRLSMP